MTRRAFQGQTELDHFVAEGLPVRARRSRASARSWKCFSAAEDAGRWLANPLGMVPGMYQLVFRGWTRQSNRWDDRSDPAA
jgi:hypothetical protein